MYIVSLHVQTCKRQVSAKESPILLHLWVAETVVFPKPRLAGFKALKSPILPQKSAGSHHRSLKPSKQESQ